MSKGKFVAKFKANDQEYLLGSFETAQEASEAYRKSWMTRNMTSYDEQLAGFSIENMT